METRNQEHLRGELIQLTEKQISTLEKQTFGGIPEAEQSEIRGEAGRIRDLFIELLHLDPAA